MAPRVAQRAGGHTPGRQVMPLSMGSALLLLLSLCLPGALAGDHEEERAGEIEHLLPGSTDLEISPFLERRGAREEAEVLRGRIRRSQGMAVALYGFGVAGGAAAVGGLVGLDNVGVGDVPPTMDRLVFQAGLATMAVGLVGGSIPATRAARLRHEARRGDP